MTPEERAAIEARLIQFQLTSGTSWSDEWARDACEMCDKAAEDLEFLLSALDASEAALRTSEAKYADQINLSLEQNRSLQALLKEAQRVHEADTEALNASEALSKRRHEALRAWVIEDSS